MAIDDYEYRSRACRRVLQHVYDPAGTFVVIWRRCFGTRQHRRKDGGQWRCSLCGKHQNVLRIPIKTR